MRHAILISSFLCLIGLTAAWSAAPLLDDAPAAEPPKANGKAEAAATKTDETTKPAADVPTQSNSNELRRLQRSPRAGERSADNNAVAGPDDMLPTRPDFRRWQDGGFGRGNREFSPEQVERVMQVVRDLDPDRAARLEEMRQNDPERFAIGLMRAGRHLLGLSLLKDRDEKLYELKVDELRLSQQINRIAQEIIAARETCSEGELDRLEDMLRARLREQSQLNFQVRAREIIMLEEHLKSTRDKLVEDIKHADDRIEERMAELLQKTDDTDETAVESFAVDDPTNN